MTHVHHNKVILSHSNNGRFPFVNVASDGINEINKTAGACARRIGVNLRTRAGRAEPLFSKQQ